MVQNGDFNLTQQGIHNGYGTTIHLMDYWKDQDTTMSYYSKCGSLHLSMCSNSFSLVGCPGVTGQGFNWPMPYSGIGLARLTMFNLEPIWLNGIPGDSRISNARNVLAAPLLEDTLYCTELHVMLITEPSDITNMDSLCYTHNGLGMYFSDSAYLPSNRPWDDGIVPQVGGWGYITNDATWRKLKGSFVADGGEEYLFIGNYSPLTDPMLQVHFQNCYTYVDWSSLWFDAVYVYNCRDTLFSVLQQDTTVCFGQSVLLTPILKGFKLQDSVTTYTWHPPSGNPVVSTNNNFTATEPGLYTVEVTINKRFKSATTFTVNWLPEAPDSNFFADSLALCHGQPQQLTLPQITGASYLWSNGDTTNYSTIGLPGMYTVQITTPCWVHTEQFVAFQASCGTRIFVPNAFTPDGDGTNDYFEIFGPLQPFTLIVSNRWGQVVYKNEDYQNNWDGTSQGEALPSGTYTYRIVYAKVEGGKKNYDLTGIVTILR